MGGAVACEVQQQVEVLVSRLDLETNACVLVALYEEPAVPEDSVREIYGRPPNVEQVHRATKRPLEFPAQHADRAGQSARGRLGQQNGNVDVAARALLVSGVAAEQVGAREGQSTLLELAL